MARVNAMPAGFTNLPCHGGLQSFAVEDWNPLPWRIGVLCREGLESFTDF